MSDTGPLGRFVWHELMTSDPDAALRFYKQTIGWGSKPFESDMPYTLWQAGETAVGGLMKLDDARMAGVPPHWLTYISTPDPDATAESARQLGGNVLMAPHDIPNVGRFAILSDPSGAVFGVYKGKDEAGEETDPQPLSFSWNELATLDMAGATRFYTQLFGWEMKQEYDMGELGLYHIFGRGRFQYGGMYQKPADMPAPPHWMPYVQVDDADAVAERARNAGGTVLHGPTEVPGGDRIVIIMDPQGATFGVHARKK
jgi:hypothetical protein